MALFKVGILHFVENNRNFDIFILQETYTVTTSYNLGKESWGTHFKGKLLTGRNATSH